MVFCQLRKPACFKRRISFEDEVHHGFNGMADEAVSTIILAKLKIAVLNEGDKRLVPHIMGHLPPRCCCRPVIVSQLHKLFHLV